MVATPTRYPSLIKTGGTSYSHMRIPTSATYSLLVSTELGKDQLKRTHVHMIRYPTRPLNRPPTCDALDLQPDEKQINSPGTDPISGRATI